MASKVAAPHSAIAIRLTLISVAMFFLYALGVLTLHQERAPNAFGNESVALPIALSYLVYGKPLGSYDANVLQPFWERDKKTSLQDTLLKAADGTIPAGRLDMYSADGIGVGTNLFATFALWLFGIDLSSLALFYLSFVGISVFAFILRFRDTRLIVVPIYFLAVSIMLLTPIGTSPEASVQVPVGGNRYFSLAAFLPALHITFELVETHSGLTWRKISHLPPLFVQALLLFAALLVRSSASYLIAVLSFVLIWRFYQSLQNRNQLIWLISKSAIIGSAFTFWVLYVVVALPAYVETGRVLGNFWHRAFISFAMHPDWPFGDLQKVYDCQPEALSHQTADANGLCIWIASNKSRSNMEVTRGLYGGEYEGVLRDAYFYVLTHYPKESFETYAYVKSSRIKSTLIDALKDLFNLRSAPVAKGLFIIIVGQLILFISSVISMVAVSRTIIDIRLTVFPMLFVLSLIPLYAAWSSLWTSADSVFLMYSCLIATALLVVQLALTGSVRRRWAGVAKC
jgi:hypothetical protein